MDSPTRKNNPQAIIQQKVQKQSHEYANAAQKNNKPRIALRPTKQDHWNYTPNNPKVKLNLF